MPNSQRNNEAGIENSGNFERLIGPIWEIVPARLRLIRVPLHPYRASTLQNPIPKTVQSTQSKKPIRKAQEKAGQSQWLALVLLAPLWSRVLLAAHLSTCGPTLLDVMKNTSGYIKFLRILTFSPESKFAARAGTAVKSTPSTTVTRLPTHASNLRPSNRDESLSLRRESLTVCRNRGRSAVGPSVRYLISGSRIRKSPNRGGTALAGHLGSH